MTGRSEVRLRQVRKDEVGALKERLSRHLPHALPVYGSLSLAARYGLHSLRPASILIPAGPVSSCFTVITSITSGPQSIVLFWSLEEHTGEDVVDYLSHLPGVDWGQRIKSLGIIGGQQVRIQTAHDGYLYSFQEPAVLELPPLYHMTRLKGEEASLVWKHWEFNNYDSVDNVKHDITHFPSVGIRNYNPKGNIESLQEETDGQLMSWIRTSKYGWMGNTFTVPQHRRRGLAGMATVALARQLQHEGIIPYVAVTNNNIASIKLHKGLGFKRLNDIATVEVLPADQ